MCNGMKYYNLYIDCKSESQFKEVTRILNLKPKDDEEFSIWCYQIQQAEDDEYLDFSQKFEDILKPNMKALNNLGITNDDIMIWLVYEYSAQCAIGFDAQEINRIANLGIAFNIDCYEIK